MSGGKSFEGSGIRGEGGMFGNSRHGAQNRMNLRVGSGMQQAHDDWYGENR
jgi:hypothetical protein